MTDAFGYPIRIDDTVVYAVRKSCTVTLKEAKVWAIMTDHIVVYSHSNRIVKTVKLYKPAHIILINRES